MQKLAVVLLLVISLVVMEVTCQDAMLAPPDRPTEFRSPDQLRQYLKALNEYYAIVGRPRFGRSVNKRSINEAVFGQADKSALCSLSDMLIYIDSVELGDFIDSEYWNMDY